MNLVDFFHAQESLTTIQWILRALVAFLFLLLAAKIMGQRSMAQLRLLDFVMAILIGNILAHPLSDQHLGLKGSMITMVVLVVLYVAGTYLSLKWKRFQRLLDPSPYPLIEQGKIRYQNLRKARISIDILLAELRKSQIEDIQKISHAIWEPNGTISFFLHPEYAPVTPADMKLAVKPLLLSRAVIKEGEIDHEELKKSGKDEAWLHSQLKAHNESKAADVLLATLKGDKLNIYHYPDQS